MRARGYGHEFIHRCAFVQGACMPRVVSFALRAAWGFVRVHVRMRVAAARGEALPLRYQMMSAFHHQRVSMIILIGGTAEDRTHRRTLRSPLQPSHICTKTGLTRPHLRRDWAQP